MFYFIMLCVSTILCKLHGIHYIWIGSVIQIWPFQESWSRFSKSQRSRLLLNLKLKRCARKVWDNSFENRIFCKPSAKSFRQIENWISRNSICLQNFESKIQKQSFGKDVNGKMEIQSGMNAEKYWIVGIRPCWEFTD